MWNLWDRIRPGIRERTIQVTKTGKIRYHKVSRTLRVPTEKIDINKNVLTILPNFIHSLDANLLINMDASLIKGTVHDLVIVPNGPNLT